LPDDLTSAAWIRLPKISRCIQFSTINSIRLRIDLGDSMFLESRPLPRSLNLPPSIESGAPPNQRVLFVVEGFTDIRFVDGLSRICELTMIVPERNYVSSGLLERVRNSQLALTVRPFRGGRLAFQLLSLLYLFRHAGGFDVILAQEALRGALNANLAGAFRKVPVVTYIGYPALEYFRCRHERERIGFFRLRLGELIIRALLAINGRAATRCLAMGPYLREIALRHCPRTSRGGYYGVNTSMFRPATAMERTTLRLRLALPGDKFIVLFSSRISHEKDPETVLKAVASVRAAGLDAVLLNLGGGWCEFLALARKLNLPECDQWLMARPAANPMTEVFEYFRAVDAVAMASLAEGAAFSTLESLACGTPVVATAVGGMATQLAGYTRLVPRQDADAMAHELLWVAGNPAAARKQALAGRDYVIREWTSTKVFSDLAYVLHEVAVAGRKKPR
jgi:glycosyltransferase involved in cell wall biosynthesis